MKENKLLDVKIFWSPVLEKEPLQEKAEVVSSKNHLGDFDILPDHVNFISLISKKITLHFSQKKKETYEFERGVLEVSNNAVRVFLGI